MDWRAADIAAGQTQQRVYAAADYVPRRHAQGETAMPYAGVFRPQDLDIAANEVVTIPFGKDPTGAAVQRYYYMGCNEVAEIEEMFGMPMSSVFSTQQRARFSTTIALLWVGFKVFDPELTKEQVGRILSRNLDQLQFYWEKVLEGVTKAMPGIFAKNKDAAQDDPGPFVAASTPTPTPESSASA